MKTQKSIIAVIALFIFALTANAQMQYRRALDFNGDGKADIAIHRNTISQTTPITWYVQNGNSYSATAWGNGNTNNSDKIVPGDYDGDGRGDYAIARATGANFVWWVLNSSDGTVRTGTFGRADFDQLMPGDYDGDGRADFAVLRNTGGLGYSSFYYLRSSDNQFQVVNINAPPELNNVISLNCYAVQGNFDGDNKADPTMFCYDSQTPNSKAYYNSVRSLDGVQTQVQWGIRADQPVFGDFDGDGRTDLAVLRGASTGGNNPIVWWIKGSMGASYAVQFGNPRFNVDSMHVPAQADYDGDNKTDIAVYDWRQGLYWILQSSNGQVVNVNFGALGGGFIDKPIRLINHTLLGDQ